MIGLKNWSFIWINDLIELSKSSTTCERYIDMATMKMVKKGGKSVPAFAADGIGKMKKGGAAGMHKMPDGKMMKNSDMADKLGRAVKRKTADVKGRAMKKGA
jgi:hypothetical protein